MPALSMIENQPMRAAAGAGYGLLQSGAAWDTARGALIAIHGRDRDGGELPALLAQIATRHHLRLLAPVAPNRAWYPGRYGDAEVNRPGRDAALAQVDALMALANEHGIGDDAILLVGFSQGACIAAEYLLWGGKRPAGAAIFTGCALSLPSPLPEGRCRGMHILMTSGRADPWLRLDDLFVAADTLERAGASVTTQIFSDPDHVVRPREIELLDELIEHLLVPKQ